MGMGMVIAVSEEFAGVIAKWLAERLDGTRVVGEVTGQGRVVTHKDPEVCFTNY